MYFFAEVDQRPLEHGVFSGADIFRNKDSIAGVGSGMYLKYKTLSDEQIVIKTGLSYTSIENAKNNLKAEAKDMGFDQILKKAKRFLNLIFIFLFNKDYLDKTWLCYFNKKSMCITFWLLGIFMFY